MNSERASLTHMFQKPFSEANERPQQSAPTNGPTSAFNNHQVLEQEQQVWRQ